MFLLQKKISQVLRQLNQIYHNVLEEKETLVRILNGHIINFY